jgi:predicted GIY-YIG superfamily endonuclease
LFCWILKPWLVQFSFSWVSSQITFNLMPFCSCYLLTPQGPARRKHTYVGSTVAPARRIKQHNRVITGGAKATKKDQPWEMLLILHGFLTWSAALHFEYVWQHIYTAPATKAQMEKLEGYPFWGTRGTVRRRLFELYTMLNMPPWSSEQLTITYTSEDAKASSYSLRPPAHMPEPIQDVDSFPATGERRPTSICFMCDEVCKARGPTSLHCGNEDCQLAFHIRCLAAHLVVGADTEGHAYLEPEGGVFPNCACELRWPLLPTKRRIGPSKQPVGGLDIGPASVFAEPRPASPPDPAASVSATALAFPNQWPPVPVPVSAINQRLPVPAGSEPVSQWLPVQAAQWLPVQAAQWLPVPAASEPVSTNNQWLPAQAAPQTSVWLTELSAKTRESTRILQAQFESGWRARAINHLGQSLALVDAVAFPVGPAQHHG